MKALATRRPLLPACARALRIKRTRQRCQVAHSTLLTAALGMAEKPQTALSSGQSCPPVYKCWQIRALSITLDKYEIGYLREFWELLEVASDILML